MEAKLKSDFGMKDAFELTALLNEIGKCISILPKEQMMPTTQKTLIVNFRQVLANLILYAKEFGDISFKNEVLALVKRWEVVK